MSDEELNPEDALLKQQRKEKKDLQATIQGLKKTASKGDKKKKKEVTEEIAKLEADLNQKHEKELQDLKQNSSQSLKQDEDQVVEDLSQDLEEVEIKEKKVSKAQKRRDKKAEKEKERLEDIAKQEEENKNGLRALETQKIKALLAARNLQISEIPSDGDCLFAGVIHQLKKPTNVHDLRKLVAEALLKFKDDFQPFLSLDDSAYEDYCQKMASTPKWGGQVEISAMSKALRIPIEVIQAEGPPVKIGHDEFKNDNAVILTYHRHYYGLGEHYNSIKPLVKNEECEDE